MLAVSGPERNDDPDVERLLALVDGPPSPGRARAMDVLGLLGVTEAVPALARIAATDPLERQHAISALGSIGDPTACAALERLLHDPPETTPALLRDAFMAKLLWGAAQPGDASLVPSIAPYAASERRRVREAAIASLLSVDAAEADGLLAAEAWRSRRRIRERAGRIRRARRRIDDRDAIARSGYVSRGLRDEHGWRRDMSRPPGFSPLEWWTAAVPLLATINALIFGVAYLASFVAWLTRPIRRLRRRPT